MDMDTDMGFDSDNESVNSQSMSVIDSFSDSRSIISSQTSNSDPRSMRSASPAPSVLPLSDEIREMMFKEEYGRNLNNYSNIYRLPADEEELDRLAKQHTMLADIMGGKYALPMYEVMAEEEYGDQKTCLDLGCGSGSWIIDVARDFPHCSAVAVDLIPMQTQDMPENLRSEVDDVNLGLEHFYGDFNVVHVRLLSSGIQDYHRMIQQIAHVVRPGGLVDMSEFDFRTYDSRHRVIDMSSCDFGPPWLSCWMHLVRSAIIQNGGDANAATHLHEWISTNPAFENVVYREYYTPMIDIPRDRNKETEIQRRVREKLHSDLLAYFSSSKPLILGSGVSEAKLAILERNCMAEVKENKIPQFTRFQCVYARKRRQ